MFCKLAYFFVEIFSNSGERHFFPVFGLRPVQVGPPFFQPRLHLFLGGDVGPEQDVDRLLIGRNRNQLQLVVIVLNDRSIF